MTENNNTDMKNVVKTPRIKKEGNKPAFRSAAKRTAYDFLEAQMKEVHRKLNANKSKMRELEKEQNTLKKDLAALYQVMNEFIK